jgi:DNA-binding response OmpR family regulator
MKKSILIVDEDHLTYNLLSPLLNDDQAEVVRASSGEDALRRLGAMTCDLCLLDSRLPDMSGLDLMKMMKSNYPQAGIIMMTGDRPDDNIMKSIREHALLHLVKPFDLFQVKAIVGELLGKRIDTYQDYNFLMARICGDKRLHHRQPFTNPENYTILCSDTDDDEQRYLADAIDICLNGLGITTNVQLEPGKIIRLRNGNEHLRGIVRWIASESQSERYRAGIQFI